MPVYTLPNGRLAVSLCINNKRVFRRLPKDATKADAKALEAKLSVAIHKNSRIPVIPGDPRLEEVMALYMDHAEHLKSWKSQRYAAIRIGQHLLNKTVSESVVAAAAFVSACKAEGLSAGTINKSLGTLKKALHLAYDQGLTPENHGGRIKLIPDPTGVNEQYLTLDDAKILASHASKKVAAAIMIASYTGMRRGEISQLRKENINETEGYIEIPASYTKTRKMRRVPISEAVKPHLAEVPLGLTPAGINSGFQRAKRACGMLDAKFHSLRHGTASMLVQNGIDLYTVGKVLGHSQPSVTQRYAKLQLENMKAALDTIK